MEANLGNIPSALRFHGVTESELEVAGITPKEFGYLMPIFTVGGIDRRALDDDDITPFQPGDYYRTLLESPDTRRVWPILERLMGPSPYKKRIQATIQEIESE